MRRITLIILSAVISVACAFAQNPIKWRSSVAMTNATEGVITMKAIVQPGWHLYGVDLPKGGPKSTTFDFSQSTDIELTGKITPSVKPTTTFDQMFQLELNWWETTVTFTQAFKVTGKSPNIKGVITYMGCNNETCTPPRKENISLTIPVQ